MFIESIRHPNRRRPVVTTMFIACIAALAPLAAGHAQNPAAYPDHPIRLIVPYTAGSIGDLFVRPVVQRLGEKLGQVVVVENRPGASQAIGASQAARATPDGYTLFMGTQSGLVLNSIAKKKLPYDAQRDFTPVSMLFEAPMYLFVNPSVSARTVQELIAYARANPGKLTFASIGAGTSSHLAGEMLKTMANIDILHVPYKGGPEATTALVAGQVDIMFNGGNVLAQLQRGSVRAIATGGLRRNDTLPTLPTLDESGLTGFDVSPWFALFTPKGVPQPIIDRLNAEITVILKDPSIREKAVALGIEVATSTPDELREKLKSDLPVWTHVMRTAGIEPE